MIVRIRIQDCDKFSQKRKKDYQKQEKKKGLWQNIKHVIRVYTS